MKAGIEAFAARSLARARGVGGLVGFVLEKVGGGGGGMAILSLSSFLSPSFFPSSFSTFFRSSCTGLSSISSGVEVVILGVSSSIVRGASLTSARERGGGGRFRNHSRRFHVEGGCL